jgi:hypothetical protein
VGLVALPAVSHAASCAPPATPVRFGGEVRDGHEFARDVGRDLVFRLVPSRDRWAPGWTIEVRWRGETAGERERSWVVTPPYRAWNPRYLDLAYGKSAAEVVAITPREFAFVADPGDFDRVHAAVRRILWPDGASDAEVDAARAVVEGARKGEGRLHIRRARLGTGADGRKWIEALAFDVELCLPGR